MESKTMPMAIVGMACRFAGGASSPEKLWQLCAEGRSAWSPVPGSRFTQDAFYHPDGRKQGATNVEGAHFLEEDISLFDAAFFNFSSEVASTMDPQFRLQLETVYEALESAGIPLENVGGSRASVFAGAFFRDYHDSLMRDPETLPRYFMTGNGAAMAANRISHFYDLRGPSMTVDTGCSTTLTTLHLACQSLRAGESDISIVAGSNILLNPDMFESMASLGFLSPSGRSYAFDHRASGYGRGEGVATLIVKPLQNALRDGDPVRAVIRETALNQDGRTATLTSPSQRAQQELVEECYAKAGLDPWHTTYVEAHGTGTQAGDPVETAALSAALNTSRPSQVPLIVGSVKSNVGHTEAASGLASIIKVVMALEKEYIPPNANFERPNDKIDLDELNIKIPVAPLPWPQQQPYPRRASINNFGYGGTNAHVIVESPTGPAELLSTNPEQSDPVSTKIFVLSAKDERAVRTMASNLAQYLRKLKRDNEGNFLRDLAFTLGQRRSVLPWTAVYAASSTQELTEKLENGQVTPLHSTRSPRLGFVFTGQGAQWYAMGRELIDTYPIFKASLVEVDQHLQSFGAPWSVLDELTRDESSSKVNQAALSLPLCTAIQIALIQLLRSWNITPTAVTGHSSGEVAAAFTAGAIDSRSAMAIVYLRGALTAGFQEKVGSGSGGMLAVGLGREAAEAYIAILTTGKVVVACVNSPESVTISGDIAAIHELESQLTANGIFARRLKVDAAYHSHHMQPFADEYVSSLQQILCKKGELGDLSYSSPVTGGRISNAADISCAENWVKNMLQPVLFLDALKDMCFSSHGSAEPSVEQQVDTIIEVGPHGALGGPIRQTLALPEFQNKRISYVSCLNRGRSAIETMHSLVSSLHGSGYRVDLGAVNFPLRTQPRRVLHDLPSYPWNHQHSHWMEPRLNKEYRLRTNANNNLLGAPLVGSNNTLAPTWRHIIRVSDIPWLRDHKVQSNIIYPGAGYITMAIEAVAQICRQKHQTVSWIRLRDVEILKALIVPENDAGVEVQLSLHDGPAKALAGGSWQTFHVSSCDGNGTWNENCRGLISAVRDLEVPLTSWAISRPGDDHYARRVNVQSFYASLQAKGIYHGRTFQNLRSVQSSRGRSLSTLAVADIAPPPLRNQHSHVLHPTTLDSVFQAVYSALPENAAGAASAMVPQAIKSMDVRSTMPNTPSHIFSVRATVHRANARALEASVVASNDGDTASMISIEGLRYQSLGSTAIADCEGNPPLLRYKLQWEPDVSFPLHNDLKAALRFAADQDEVDTSLDIRRACFYFVHDAMAGLTKDAVLKLNWHQRRYYEWMKLQVKLAKQDELGPTSSEWITHLPSEKQALLNRVRASSVDGEMVCRIGENLPAILRNDVAPLSLMLKDDLLYEYYAQGTKWNRAYHQIYQLVQHFSHKNPRARILEVGAGTGGCTGVVLDALREQRGAEMHWRCASYDFTDISPGFFQAADARFKALGDVMDFKKLDIEVDPSSQGFESGSYDLVIACQVLHATKNMKRTLQNVRKLLSPGGKLMMVECTRDEVDLQLIFGVLPGWWLGEEPERLFSPSLSVPEWQTALQTTGFGGIDVEVHDCEDESLYSLSVMMAGATVPVEDPYPQFTIAYKEAPPKAWLDKLATTLGHSTGSMPVIEHINHAKLEGRACIFLGEVHESLLDDPEKGDFDVLRSLIANSAGLLWLTRGGTMDCDRPHNSLHTGLLRTLRTEYSSKRLISLDLDPVQERWPLSAVASIADVVKVCFHKGEDPGYLDCEYAERGGIIYAPRILEASEEEMVVPKMTNGHPTPTRPFNQSDHELQLRIKEPGLLDTLGFSIEPSPAGLIPKELVEIEPRAFGLNFRDVMVAMGQLDVDLMGFECSGVVSRVGSAASLRGFKAGDRVCALMRGGWANRVRVHWTSVTGMPDDMSFEVAATIPMAFTTAYYSLHVAAHIQKGETVLLHSASGGVGQAAIKLAQRAGAEIFVTAGSTEKRDYISSQFGIPHDHIFSSRDAHFAAQIMRMTGGKGVDIVVNFLAGELLQQSFNCVALFGRFVEIGKRDLEQNSQLEMHAFTRHVSFSSVDLIALGEHKGPVVSQIMTEVMTLIRKGDLQPIQSIITYPIPRIEEAFRMLQAGKHIGKIVVVPHSEDQVTVLPSKWSVQLGPQSTYLVVGGTGGIGRSICQWLVDRGARHLVILSRSAKQQDHTHAFVEELRQSGCAVAMASCDIANKAQLQHVLHTCLESMPPLRGVIHCGMVLQDTVFENMSVEDYTGAIRPKVQGTWNLHQALSDMELDYFVMLSSFAGITGNVSQANYSAGGTFQDAIARHRSARALPGVAIDLGMVKDVGYVAETDGVASRLERMGFQALEEEDVLRVLEDAIVRPVRRVTDSQIMMGLDSRARAQANSTALWMKDRKFAGISRVAAASGKKREKKATGSVDLGTQLDNASSADEQLTILIAAMVRKLSEMFLVDEDSIRPEESLAQYGVDSLVAVELRNWLVSHTGSEVSIFDIVQSASLRDLAQVVGTKITSSRY